jgi:hypothetical protein
MAYKDTSDHHKILQNFKYLHLQLIYCNLKKKKKKKNTTALKIKALNLKLVLKFWEHLENQGFCFGSLQNQSPKKINSTIWIHMDCLD